MTTYETIRNFLIDKGFEVFAPSEHQGECKQPYIVLSGFSEDQYFEYSSSEVQIVFLSYTPVRDVRLAEVQMRALRGALKELQTALMIRDTKSQTPLFYDDTVKGYMISRQYSVYKRNGGI